VAMGQSLMVKDEATDGRVERDQSAHVRFVVSAGAHLVARGKPPQAAVFGPHPEGAVRVLVEGQDVGIGQTVGGKGLKAVVLAVVVEEAEARRADPEVPVWGRVDDRDGFGDLGVVDEAAGVPVVAVQPADGAHLQRAGRVHRQRLDGVVGQGVGVGAPVAEDGEGGAVVAVQAVLGAEPEEALTVLDDGVDDVVGEAVGGGEVEEARSERRGTRGRRQGQAECRKEEKTSKEKRCNFCLHKGLSA
jgi:hypothetical protein